MARRFFVLPYGMARAACRYEAHPRFRRGQRLRSFRTWLFSSDWLGLGTGWRELQQPSCPKSRQMMVLNAGTVTRIPRPRKNTAVGDYIISVVRLLAGKFATAFDFSSAARRIPSRPAPCWHRRRPSANRTGQISHNAADQGSNPLLLTELPSLILSAKGRCRKEEFPIVKRTHGNNHRHSLAFRSLQPSMRDAINCRPQS